MTLSTKRRAAFVAISMLTATMVTLAIRFSPQERVPVAFVLMFLTLGLCVLAGLIGTASLNKKS